MRTYYLKVLGLGENATLSDIKKAYRTLARKYHPDVSSLPNAKEKFIAITEAYNYLSSPQKTPPKKKQTWQQPAAKPKTSKAKSEVEERREKMRAFLRKKHEMERAEIEALRKMTLREFMKSAYFRNTRKDLINLIISGPGFGVLSVIAWVAYLFFSHEAHTLGVFICLIPFAFSFYALFSRPK